MAQTYHYTLLDILRWNLYGQWMHFVFARGYSVYWRNILLPRFSDTVPRWWSEVHYDPRWWRNNLTNRIPNATFKGYYKGAAKYHFEGWIRDAARGIAKPLVDAVSNLLGSLLHSYTTFSAWIDAIRTRVGTYVPSWATSLADAAKKLWRWFPTAIRLGISTWSDIWEGIKTAVKDWAKIRFDAAMTWVANTAPWIFDWVNFLSTWYYAAGEWVTNFKNDPYGTVAGWLGTAWSTWTGIYGSILDFYNTVWVPFKMDLHDFLDHPVLWLEDRIDEEVDLHRESISRWLGSALEKIIEWGWEHG